MQGLSRRVAWLLLASICAASVAGPADQAVWFRGGLPTQQALMLLTQLDAAADYGLDSEDYHAGSLAAMVEQLRHESISPDVLLQQTDVWTPATSSVPPAM